MAEYEKPVVADTEKPQPSADHFDDLAKVTTVDTIHNDEGMRVLANYHGDLTWTAAEEKKLTRKIDRRLLSILCVTYGLQYYDKAMLSQAVSISDTRTESPQKRLSILTRCVRHSSGYVQS